MINSDLWLEEIKESIKELGGKANLEQIYNKIIMRNKLNLSLYTDWKSVIRKNIYLHSSDCDIFVGMPGDENDIFHSFEGKGSGVWAFREEKYELEEIYSGEIELYPFIRGEVYKRSEIHDKYGGNRRRGISNSKGNPMIFIFTSKEGKTYGYQDGWQDNDIFYYTGEGQIGDQEFKEGNKTLQDHIENGKDVFLFESFGVSGKHRFVNQLTYIGHHFRQGHDKLGKSRRMIVFEFAITENLAQSNSPEEINKVNDLNLLRAMASIAGNTEDDSSTVFERKMVVRKRAAAIKKYALVRANGFCEACDELAPFVKVNMEPFLEVHHLTRLSDGGIDKPKNVAAICPNCHRRVHYSKDGKEYNDKLIKKIREREIQIHSY